MRIGLFVLIISIGWMLSNVAAAAPISEIVLKPVPHIVPMQIRNMDTIDDVFVAGHSAWAVNFDHAQVAFFNGESWKSGVRVSDMATIRGFFPAYPLSGVKPNAWMWGSTSQYATLISFFNGQRWSTVRMASIVGPTDDDCGVSFSVSGGYAYLLESCTNENTNKRYINWWTSSADNPAKWQRQATITGNIVPAGGIDSMSELGSPMLYAMVAPTPNQHLLLYRFTPGKVPEVVHVLKAESSSVATGLFTHGSYVFTNYWQSNMAGNPTWLSFPGSTKKQKTWYDINDAANTTFLSGTFGERQFYQGTLCKTSSTSDPSTGKNELYLVCLNANDVSPAWQQPQFITLQPVAWNMALHPGGVWLGYHLLSRSGGAAVILGYNFNNHIITNTHYPAIDNTDTLFESILPDGILACSANAMFGIKPTLHYYNSAKPQLGWQQLNTSDINIKHCKFSWGGVSHHFINRVDPAKGETTWLYNRPKNSHSQLRLMMLPKPYRN